MIRIGVSEMFPLTATLIDEINSIVCTGRTVLYEIRRQPGDIPTEPALSGVLVESNVIPGIYTVTLSINTIGTYLAYISCSEFVSYSEEIIVSLSLAGIKVPEIMSERYGAIKMLINNNNNIRMSTKAITPIMSTSIGV